jgi:hypothetical protein
MPNFLLWLLWLYDRKEEGGKNYFAPEFIVTRRRPSAGTLFF